VIEREEPLLAAHDVTMWEYVVLSSLAAGATPTQVQPAQLLHSPLPLRDRQVLLSALTLLWSRLPPAVR
jgi:hypothetical protein